MPISIQCPQCSKQYVVADALAGKKVKCRECGSPVPVPFADPELEGMSGEEMPAPAAQAKMANVRRCPSCRTPMPASKNYCTACGWSPTAGDSSSQEAEPAVDAASPKKKKKWVRDPGRPALNSLDSLINLIIWWSLLAGIAVWIVHIAKTPQGVSLTTLLPLIAVLVATAGIMAPLMLVGIKLAARFMQFIPRDDTYNRILLCLFLPLAMSLLAGWPGMNSPIFLTLVGLSWVLAPALFIYFFRAETMEWISSVAAGGAGLLAGWVVLNMVASPLNSVATLYKPMLPEGPWSLLATADLPAPATQPAPQPATPTTGPAIVKAGGASTQSGAGWLKVAGQQGTDEDANAETKPAPTTQVAAAPPPAAPAPAAFTFLTNVVSDNPDLQSVGDIQSAPAPSPWMLVYKPNADGTSVDVEPWSTSPLEKKGSFSFPQLPRDPNSYAISPNGNILVAAVHFPRNELQVINTQTRNVQVVPVELPAKVLGFIDPLHVLLTWMGPRGQAVLTWNPTIKVLPSRSLLLDRPLMDPNWLAVSPNGKYIAFFDGNQIIIYDTTENSIYPGWIIRKIMPATGITRLTGMTFSPDSTQVAISAIIQNVSTILSFKVMTGAPVYSGILGMTENNGFAMPRNTASIPGLLWSQDGSFWVVNGEDLYDTTNGKKIGSMNIPNLMDVHMVGPKSIVLVQGAENSHPGEEASGKGIVAQFDQEAIKAAIRNAK